MTTFAPLRDLTANLLTPFERLSNDLPRFVCYSLGETLSLGTFRMRKFSAAARRIQHVRFKGFVVSMDAQPILATLKQRYT